jgi:nitrogen fixation NifU-like protein
MSGLDDLYRETILEHFRHPRHRGTIENPDFTFDDSNPLCGDHIRMDVKVENGVIADAKFSGHGCAISQAAADLLCDEVIGKTLEEAKSLSREDVLGLLGIPLGPVRLKCGMLALKTLKAGVYGIDQWPGEDDEEEK